MAARERAEISQHTITPEGGAKLTAGGLALSHDGTGVVERHGRAAQPSRQRPKVDQCAATGSPHGSWKTCPDLEISDAFPEGIRGIDVHLWSARGFGGVDRTTEGGNGENDRGQREVHGNSLLSWGPPCYNQGINARSTSQGKRILVTRPVGPTAQPSRREAKPTLQ